MSDNEWERWKTTFRKGERPMPDVVKRARRDRRKQLVGMGVVYVGLAGVAASEIPALLHARTLAEYVGPIVHMSLCAAFVVAVHLTMRGTFGRHGVPPLEALAALERRHRARIRLTRMIPWVGAFFVAANVATDAMTVGVTGPTLETLAVLVLFVAGLVAFVYPRLRARLEREAREAAEARRLLGETGDEGAEGKG
jgi:hypothetical protein